MSNSNSSSSGIGVMGLLGVSFVVLKLTEVIDWSWWWVTLPFWGGIIVLLIIIAIYLLILSFGELIRRREITKIAKSTSEESKLKKQSVFQKRIEDMEEKRKKKHLNKK